MFELPQEVNDLIYANPQDEAIYYTTVWDGNSFMGTFLWNKGYLVITNFRVIFYKKFLFQRVLKQIYIKNIIGFEIEEPNLFESWINIISSANKIRVLVSSKKVAFEIQEILDYLKSELG